MTLASPDGFECLKVQRAASAIVCLPIELNVWNRLVLGISCKEADGAFAPMAGMVHVGRIGDSCHCSTAYLFSTKEITDKRVKTDTL